MSDLTRREFIKLSSAAAVAMAMPVEVFAADDCTAKTRYGIFKGFVDENGVKTWLGIPYAQPPVGKLRWQAPEPLKPTNKAFDAKKFGLSPFQTAMKIETPIEDDEDTPQSEDCLTLNIWTRGDGKNKPVMVWIYGGACVTGYSSEPNNNGSKFAAAQDVVVVNFNYRLNIFGFLNLSGVDSAYEDSGYLGTKDQLAAVKWVKENIAAFGGDPDNITVFGESAGSISTMLLTVIPDAKGIFGKVIPQSGHVAFYNDPETSARFAEKFVAACGAKKIGDLMKKSGDELKTLYKQFRDSNSGTNLAHFMPTCDGKFLPRDPVQALRDGAARGIKFLTGTTADEWRAFLMGAENFFDIYRADPADISPVFRKYKAQTPEEVYKSGSTGVPIPRTTTQTSRRRLIGASGRNWQLNINQNLRTRISTCSLSRLPTKFCARVTRSTFRTPSTSRTLKTIPTKIS